MSNKSHIIQRPKIAVFDLFNLAHNNYSGAVDDPVNLPRHDRRKRNRRTMVPDETQLTAHMADNARHILGSARIAVLVENLSDHNTNKIISGIEMAAQNTGYEIAILNVLGKQGPLDGLCNFEGFIVCCSDTSVPDLEFLKEMDKPVVIVGNVENAKEYHCVKTDYYRGAQLAVSHLIDRGCQKILMISSACSNTAAELDKYLGYRDTLKKCGKKWYEPLIIADPGVEAGMEMAAKMCINGALPDGIFISNDWVAAGFLKYLKKVEGDLTVKTTVIGFGNESLCQMIAPGLCSIDFRKELAGSAALNALLAQTGIQRNGVNNQVTIIEPAFAPGYNQLSGL